MAGKLYIALEDLKERYRNGERGPSLIKAYVRSLEDSRKINGIAVLLKENKTVEFVINGIESQDILQEIKQDIQGELCAPYSARKYQQPSRYLPSAGSISTKVSEEACRVMNLDDQRRLSGSKVSTLTMEALDAHDAKERTGPCQLRQFGCPLCMRTWWHNVLRSKPVSRCRGGHCGNQRYDALPRCKEFGVGRFLCPNTHCGRRFFGYCEATNILQCRKCGTPSMPYIHPKWRKNRSNLNPKPKAVIPRFKFEEVSFPDIGRLSLEDDDRLPMPTELRAPSLTSHSTINIECNTSEVDMSEADPSESDDSEIDAISQASSDWLIPTIRSTATLSDSDDDTFSQCSYSAVLQRGLNIEKTPSTPEKQLPPQTQPYRQRIFNASEVHEPTGGTISTFLTQLDFEIAGEEVVLDYDEDVDDDQVGNCKFECVNCNNGYAVICRMQDTAACFNCHTSNRPLNWAAHRAQSYPGPDCKHNCSRCNGIGHCPNLHA